MKFNLSSLKVKKLDRYIIKKFLGTYFFTISLLIVIVVIFDYSEKFEDFMELNAPVKAIIFDYYVNFIPFFFTQFSGLITFISVILFTSKMAYQTEIIAILASGVSFKRMLYPYILSSAVITILSLSLNLYILPNSNVVRMEFEAKYRKKNQRNQYDDYIFRQVKPGTFVQIRGYNRTKRTANFFVVSTYNKGELISMVSASNAEFNDKTKHWTAKEYINRKFEDGIENLVKGENLDTLINLTSQELGDIENYAVTLDRGDLNNFIDEQQAKGSDMMSLLFVEKQKRLAYPISTFILTIIGVSLSSRKVRGGTGLHMSIGIALCFSYILLMKFAEEYAKSLASNGVMISVWAPNILYLGIAMYLYKKAPK